MTELEKIKVPDPDPDSLLLFGFLLHFIIRFQSQFLPFFRFGLTTELNLCTLYIYNACLNHMMFSVYKEYVDALDIPALAKEFVLRYPKRESIFEIPK